MKTTRHCHMKVLLWLKETWTHGEGLQCGCGTCSNSSSSRSSSDGGSNKNSSEYKKLR
jgi:hypothetical protein